jgi:hypothetical protein
MRELPATIKATVPIVTIANCLPLLAVAKARITIRNNTQLRVCCPAERGETAHVPDTALHRINRPIVAIITAYNDRVPLSKALANRSRRHLSSHTKNPNIRREDVSSDFQGRPVRNPGIGTGMSDVISTMPDKSAKSAVERFLRSPFSGPLNIVEDFGWLVEGARGVRNKTKKE